MANSYLTRTNSSTGSTTKATISMWVKFSNISTAQALWENYGGSGNYFRIRYESDSTLVIQTDINNSTDVQKKTNRKFRDINAWYHIVVAINLSDSTQEDKYILYVNGVRETSFATNNNTANTSGNYVGGGNGFNFTIGRHPSDDAYFQGYISHYSFVDGTNLTPTSFGETDSTSGIWKFKSPSGITWGTNGFHLKMENSGAMGTDSSGNSNTFTVNGNLKQAVDTPSNVFATWNPLLPDSGSIGFDNGNTTFTNGSAANWRVVGSTLAASAGKWYCEIKITELGGGSQIGVMNLNELPQSLATDLGSAAWSWSYYNTGNKRHSNTSTSYGDTYTTGDIMGIAMDLDNNKLYFHKNGVYQNSGVPTSGATGTGSAFDLDAGGVYAFGTCSNDTGTNPIQDANFGNGFFGTTAITSAGSNGNGSLFEYDVPSGYYALNTKNINTYG